MPKFEMFCLELKVDMGFTGLKVVTGQPDTKIEKDYHGQKLR